MDNSSTDVKIVVVGSYGVGISLTVDRVPDAGETVIGQTFRTGHGGKGSNQAVAAARLGASVSLCTVVGNDAFGDDARTLWAAEGVDFRMTRTIEGSTMIGMILVDKAGENRIAIVPGVLDKFTVDALDPLAVALVDADVLLVGLEIPIATAFGALRIGRKAGVTTILNPAPAPATALPDGMLALVDHLIPNRTEAARLSGLAPTTDAEVLINSAVFADVETVVLTLGAEGALVRRNRELTHLEAASVPVVDTTGAGDSFNAAYAVMLARGTDPVDAARFAVRAAARCVTRHEVIPSLPYASDLDWSFT
ncbi:MAG: ribokinase [Ilumatobacteraceae bacterium]